MIGKENATSPGRLPVAFCLLVGAAPLLMALAPLSFSPDTSGWQMYVRIHSFVLLPVELLAVFILMYNGGSAVRGWKELPRLTQMAIALLTVVSVYTSFQPQADHLAATIGLSRVGFAVLLALALLGSEQIGKADWHRLWLAMGVGAIAYFGIFALYALTNALTLEQWIGPFPGFNNIRHVAVLGLVAFCAGLAHILLCDKQPDLRRYLISAGLFGGSGLSFILWTGGRGPLLAVFSVAFCCFAIFPGKRKSIILYSALALASGIVVASLIPIPSPIFGLLQAFGLSDLSAPDLNIASSGRLEIWQYSIGEVLKRPWFGWGINQYQHFAPETRIPFLHPHNFPLQLLFASGVVGAMLLAVAVVAFVFPRLRGINSDSQRFNAAVVLTLLLYSLYDGILYFAYPMMIFVIVFIGCLQPQSGRDRSG